MQSDFDLLVRGDEFAVVTIALIAFALLVTSWVVYPLAIAAIAHTRKSPHRPARADLPSIAAIIATRDAPETVLRRVEDVRNARYPSSLLQVIVAVDARSEYTAAEHSAKLGSRARVVQGDAPGGKGAALNAAVRAATAELLVFADSHQSFAPNTIPHLARFLDDQRYGAVSGAVVQDSGDGLMDLYWKYELLIRRGQSAISSIVSTSGGVQAVRRALWQPLPVAVICDDLYLTMRLVRQGYRVGFCESAQASDLRRFTKRQHFQRKVRTLTGLFQCIAWEPAVLLPWKNPIWVHFWCHKVMRLVTPYLVILVTWGAVSVVLHVLRAMAWLPLAVLAGGLATMAIVRPSWGKTFAAEMGWLLLLLLVPIVSTANGLQKRWSVWHYHQPLKDA